MKKIHFLLFLGFLLRLVLSIQIYSGDVNNHIAWGEDALRFGLAGIYGRNFETYGVMTPTYPPIPLLFFTGCHWLYKSVYQLSWDLNLKWGFFPSNLIFFLEDQDTHPAFLKLPAILADLGIAWIIYLVIKKMLGKAGYWPLAGAGLVLFNPAFFYNSASWGQIEAVPLFFLLAAFYFLFFTGRQFWSVFFLALTILTKQTSIIFLPIFALGYWFKLGLKKTLTGALGFGLTFWALFLPFYQKGNLLTFPWQTYLVKIQTGSGSNYVTDHAFNFWSLLTGLGKIPDWRTAWLGLSYSQWGYLFFALAMVPVFWLLWKRKAELPAFIFAACLVSFSAFLFLTRMHERYLQQVLPFLLLLSVRKKPFLAAFGLLSLIHLINLYHNWWAPGSRVLESLFSQMPVINLLILTEIGIFAWLYVRYLKGVNK